LDILVGTNNKNKLEQWRRIFGKHIPGAKLFSLEDLGIVQDVEEDAETLRGNAEKKARFFGDIAKMMTVSDDTGLYIDALNGEPGLHAKRWLEGTDTDRNNKILERMAGLSQEKRTCRYIGALAIYDPKENKMWTFESALEGGIAEKPVEGVGFGFDPIFITESYGKFYSQLTDNERDAISHRGLGIAEYAKISN